MNAGVVTPKRMARIRLMACRLDVRADQLPGDLGKAAGVDDAIAEVRAVGLEPVWLLDT